MSPSPLAGLFDEARSHFERYCADLAGYGLAVGAQTRLLPGDGMLCHYDRADGNIHLCLPDPSHPLGNFLSAVFKSVLHCDSDADLADLVRLLLPTLMAHELGHLLRDRCGRFGSDLWLEEQVANQMASALAEHHLSPAQREALVRKMRRTLHHLAPSVGSAQIAVASYLDPLQAFGASGLLAPAAVRSLEMMQRLLTLSPERVLRAMPQPPQAVLARFDERAGTIAGFNEDYSAGLARYVYFQFGWLLIQLESPEKHYVDEVAQHHLGRVTPLLPAIEPAAEPRTEWILGCHQAFRALAERAPVMSRYFFKRYRSLLLDKVVAAQAGRAPDAPTMDTQARRLLECQIEEDDGTLDFLAVVAPPELRALFPGPLAERPAGGTVPAFACETDRRLWALFDGGPADLAASNTRQRLEQLNASEIYRALSAELLLRLAHAVFEVRIPAGVTLIEQGCNNDDVFIVTHGAFDVFVADDGASRRVAGMGPGEVVGDMAFLTGAPRSASIRAAVDSACLVLRAADLKLMAFEHPTVLLRMARVLVRRLPERWSPAAA
jgi:hypothetical protein